MSRAKETNGVEGGSAIQPMAFGIGIASRSRSGRTLEVFFPFLRYRSEFELATRIAKLVGHTTGNATYNFTPAHAKEFAASFPKADKDAALFNKLATTTQTLVAVFLATDSAPASTEEAYLKLSLLSHKLARPLELNLSSVFEVLPNVAWTSEGPIDIDEIDERLLEARLKGGRLHVHSVDRFPKLLDHVVPENVRVTDGSRVRLGAFLGPGTTVMQTGLVNFNAGTEGPNMVEGRVSVGVFVGGGSDLGGGSSIMSSIYRDASNISIGKDCVVGANSGAGISLGDECTIEAGLYVTAGTKVEMLDSTGRRLGTIKARDLSGKNNLLFRRNSSTGQVEALRSDPTVQLNKKMHINR